MRLGGWMVMAALLLAACGNDAPAPPMVERTAAANPAAEVQGPQRRILAFGDSLFAGYRLGRNEGYPEKLQAALRARGINARVIDAGVSGDTSAAGLQRLEFVLDGGPRPDLVLVEFGGNDLLRGIAPAETRENLAAILAELRDRQVPVVLMGMRAPPNLGPAFTGEFDAIYSNLAERYGAALVPFFLAPIYDKPELLQQDHIHPTKEGVDVLVATTVEKVMEALPKG